MPPKVLPPNPVPLIVNVVVFEPVAVPVIEAALFDAICVEALFRVQLWLADKITPEVAAVPNVLRKLIAPPVLPIVMPPAPRVIDGVLVPPILTVVPCLISIELAVTPPLTVTACARVVVVAENTASVPLRPLHVPLLPPLKLALQREVVALSHWPDEAAVSQ